jgi:hypothetical protein
MDTEPHSHDNIQTARRGQVRVGRKVSNILPQYPGFTNIVIVMKSHSEWWPLSPYYLKTDKNYRMENVYQFSKVYQQVPQITYTLNRNDNTVIWNWPAEKHMNEDGTLLPEYWLWRQAGFNNKYAVRYPVGFSTCHNSLYSLIEKEGKPLDCIETRKQIYAPIYIELVKQQKLFKILKQRLQNGENLLIIEVDGPHEESLLYYKEKYGVADDFIINSTMLVDSTSINIMLND